MGLTMDCKASILHENADLSPHYSALNAPETQCTCTYSPATHMEDQGRVPGSYFQSDLDLAVVAILGVSLPVYKGSLSGSLLASLSHSIFQIMKSRIGKDADHSSSVTVKIQNLTAQTLDQ